MPRGPSGTLEENVLDRRSRTRTVTTYCRNGITALAPVWHAGGKLRIWRDHAWKVGRTRYDARVVVTASSHCRRIQPGVPSLSGRARLLAQDGTDRMRRLLGRKYLAANRRDASSHQPFVFLLSVNVRSIHSMVHLALRLLPNLSMTT